MDQGGSAAGAAVHSDGVGGAIALAGAALDAGLVAHEPRPAVLQAKDAVRADHGAQPAAKAARRIVL
jgi:hypothetical protein